MLETLQSVGIFFLFLGPLVFFHELGHFLVARFAGVKVETFSIGFGPKLFSKKLGDTVYAFSLIPLGGYVKMFGDDPLSENELTEEEKKVAYTHKSKMARFWIVFGGPLANFILAFVIYFFLVMGGEKVPETKFGIIPSNAILYSAGIRTGDVLHKVNEQEIVSAYDLGLLDSDVEYLTVKRDGKELKIDYQARGIAFVTEFSKYSNYFRAPVVINSNQETYLITRLGEEASQTRSFDEYLHSDYKKFELIKIKNELRSQTTTFDRNSAEVVSDQKIIIELTGNKKLIDVLRENKLYPLDLHVRTISANSAAAESKVKAGDILISINGKALNEFNELRNIVQKNNDEDIKLEILSTEGIRSISLKPKIQVIDGQELKIIGIGSNVKMLPVKMIEVSTSGFVNQITKAWNRTIDGTIKTTLGFKKLITGEVSLKSVGGPLAIGQVASQSFGISLSMFFSLMALISINLGVINLFPIPVLDGGHIVFIALEALNGGPLSRKKLMIAQQAGMSLLFLLIFVALFNDITRFF